MKYNRHNQAFTLAEVILAIGIMGMGMVFAACLFPVAIKESNASYDDVVGKMVCESGLAIALSQINDQIATSALSATTYQSYSNFTDVTNLIVADPTPPYINNPENSNTRFIPVSYTNAYVPANNKEKGFVIFWKYSSNLSTFAVLSYQASTSDTVTGQILDGTIVSNNNVYTYNVTTGTPLKGGILFENGQFARILSVTGANATLDRQVPVTSTSVPNIKGMIIENNNTHLNPTMFGIVTQTGI